MPSFPMSKRSSRSLIPMAFMISTTLAWAVVITHPGLESSGSKFAVGYPTNEEVYHVLYRGRELDSLDRPVNMALGGSGPTGVMTDSVPMKNDAFYRVLTLPLSETQDTDGDGLTDVEELRLPDTQNPLNPAIVAPQHGSPIIRTRAQFEAMARRDNVPGAAGIREVKFLMTDVDTERPKLFFIDTQRHIYHYYFAYFGLDWRNVTLTKFNSETYFTESNRKNLAGSLLAHDSYVSPNGQASLYTLEFWPTDPVPVHFIELAYEMISTAMPFVDGNLAYHAAGETQRAVLAENRHRFEASQIRTISTEELFGSQTFSALNPGKGLGRLHVAGVSGDAAYSARDVVIFRNIPNDLSHVAGIITEIPQTPLSHINLKARQNKTPNAYIKGAVDDPRIAPFIGEYVVYEVTPDGFTIEPATVEEVDAYLESIRPSEPQTPERNSDIRTIAKLGWFTFDHTDAYGAKATNLSELRRILPSEMVPEGHAIPFHYYHTFMEENGFYEMLDRLLAIEGFFDDPVLRQRELERFRERIEDGRVSEAMEADFEAIRAHYPPGTSLRCRSSTNNEDLPGFNGAGLYSSFTHHPEEGPLSKSIKQVWASMWNYRAFEERDFYRIDHHQAAMGVAVHPNYDQEQCNGVAVTKNIIDPNWTGYYVNVQVGEDLVTNPEADSIPEEFLVSLLLADPEYNDYQYEIQYVRKSNLRVDGEPILTRAQVFDLAGRMQLIQRHFRKLYRGDSDFGMEIEFKITADGRLAIKQARPWID